MTTADDSKLFRMTFTEAWIEYNNIQTLLAHYRDDIVIKNIWLLLEDQEKRNMMDIDRVDDLKAVLQHAWSMIP